MKIKLKKTEMGMILILMFFEIALIINKRKNIEDIIQPMVAIYMWWYFVLRIINFIAKLQSYQLFHGLFLKVSTIIFLLPFFVLIVAVVMTFFLGEIKINYE